MTSSVAISSARRGRLRRAGLVLGMVLSLVAPAAPAAMAADPSGVDCREVHTPVTFAGGSGQISGTLCVPPGGAHTVQLLVHGYSYARYYWDFPYEPETYSYVRAANSAGYATLAIDRIGDGKSTRPPGVQLTWDTAADTVNQVITALRAGDLGESFDKVALVGHSYGSVTSYLVAGRYHSVDALVVTGIAHRVNLPDLTARLIGQSPPAALDPKFADTGLDPLYVTTRAGARDLFYATANTDPRVIEIDEKLKETAGLLEIPTAAQYLLNNVSKTTNIPVLTVNADKDTFFCGPLAADCSSDEALADFERPFYGPDATVEAMVIPGGGHDVNLERTAPQAYARMLDFVDRHLGT
ncbi:alpha/beta hydrolase [Prauserella flavalba]|uniref:alpha/beta hydrolase n=1 Tax=Prauserella flavalba TaxID=1477506 RepID=UPI0036E5FD8C